MFCPEQAATMLRLPYVQGFEMIAYVIGFYPAVNFGLSQRSAASLGQLDPVHRRRTRAVTWNARTYFYAAVCHWGVSAAARRAETVRGNKSALNSAPTRTMTEIRNIQISSAMAIASGP